MLRRPSVADVTIWWGDTAVPARSGDSVAVALLAAGIRSTRKSAVSAAPRGAYCLMGACFECLAEVDGKANVQTCMVTVRDGMKVRLQEPAQGM